MATTHTPDITDPGVTQAAFPSEELPLFTLSAIRRIFMWLLLFIQLLIVGFLFRQVISRTNE